MHELAIDIVVYFAADAILHIDAILYLDASLHSPTTSHHRPHPSSLFEPADSQASPTLESFLARFPVHSPPPQPEGGGVAHCSGVCDRNTILRTPAASLPVDSPRSVSAPAPLVPFAVIHADPPPSPGAGIVLLVADCLSHICGLILTPATTSESSPATVPALQRLLATPDPRLASLLPTVPVTRFDSLHLFATISLDIGLGSPHRLTRGTHHGVTQLCAVSATSEAVSDAASASVWLYTLDKQGSIIEHRRLPTGWTSRDLTSQFKLAEMRTCACTIHGARRILFTTEYD